MCRTWVERLKRWDRHDVLTFRPYQDPAVPGLFPWIPQDAFKEAVQVVAPDGRTWEGAGAAERLAHILPWGGPLAFLFRLPLVRDLADSVYRWVAEHRGESCSIHGGG